ncbi:MAG: DUF2007 domain-containing protein [Spirochaetales bacterium]|nr:DUF2007 domain-containing protein [Spirochaetales bacterium]
MTRSRGLCHNRHMITVARFGFRFQAEHALVFLRQNKIEAILWGDDMGGLNPAIGFLESFEIRVHPDQEVIARELLSDFGMAQPESRRTDRDDDPLGA